MIIDVHSHLFDDNPRSRNFGFFGEPEGPVSLDTFARHALAQGVDLMILSADPEWGKTPEGLAGGNARVADLVRRHPQRFAGLCQVSPFLVDESLAQMDRHIANGNLIGIGELCQYVLNYETDDARMDAFIERAIELDVPVLEHSSVLQQSDGIARLAERFPRARFVMAHLGGMYNWPHGLEVARAHDNVWVDTSGFVMLCLGAMRRALAEIGPSKILFGVDFPLIEAAPLVAALKNLRLSTADFDLLAWKNASELFHLPLPNSGT
jgi:predicted TIM-barrel fold metal-dependent hydrolase